MTPKELAEKLMDAQRKKRLEAHQKIWTPSLTPATDLGHECIRRCVYHRIWPEKANPISVELASIFDEGNHHEKEVRKELIDLGYEILEADRNFRDERLEITGTIDGKIALGDEHRAKRIPVEIKSSYGDGPPDEEAWKNSETPLLRRYYAQLQTYMFLSNTQDALGLFKNKQTGLWTCVAIGLDYEYAESLLKRAEKIRDAVALIKEANTEEEKLELLPDRTKERENCDACPWKDTMCHPADAPIDPMMLIDDENLLACIEERETLDKPRKKYKKLDDNLKARFKNTKGDRFIVGPADRAFVVTKKAHGKGIRIEFERLTNKTE